jgi:hypothetical protein
MRPVCPCRLAGGSTGVPDLSLMCDPGIVTDRDDEAEDAVAMQRAVVARLRGAMTEQADRLDHLVDDGARFVPRIRAEGRDALVDVLTSAALVAQAARDFAAQRIDHAEYERRLGHARALLPDL